MNTRHVASRKLVARPSRSLWLATATLVAVLLLGGFAGIPRVAASEDGSQIGVRQYAVERSRLLTHESSSIDAGGWPSLDGYSVSAAHGAAFAAVPQTDVAKFYAERMRVLADQSSSFDADSAGWPSLNGYSASAALAAVPQTGVAKFYAERMRVLSDQASSFDADSGGWPSLNGYSAALATLPQTDVAKFYAERTRVPAGQISVDADSAR